MSNSLAIAVATRGLVAKLGEAIATSPVDPTGALVSTVRPNVLVATQAAVNAFLYQVAPNAALRNEELPTRRGGGQLVRKPELAIDLHYLLTFTGDEAELIPQRIMGIVLPALHAFPELTPTEIERLIKAGSPGFMDPADLARQLERVRFSLSAINLEELSKLWSVFFQTQYLLSVPLQASVVLLEAPLVPHAVRPVQERGVYVGPVEQPRLSTVVPPFVVPAQGAEPPRLAVSGTALSGERTLVRLDAGDPIAALASEPTRIVFELPQGILAGTHTVRALVQHRFEAHGAPKLFDLESNSLAFAVVPQIVSPSPQPLVDRVLTLDLEPQVAWAQRVRVIFERQVPVAERYVLIWQPPPREAGEDPTFATIDLTLPSQIGAGQWFVRVEVDGVVSTLGDTAGDLPFVEVL